MDISIKHNVAGGATTKFSSHLTDILPWHNKTANDALGMYESQPAKFGRVESKLPHPLRLTKAVRFDARVTFGAAPSLIARASVVSIFLNAPGTRRTHPQNTLHRGSARITAPTKTEVGKRVSRVNFIVYHQGHRTARKPNVAQGGKSHSFNLITRSTRQCRRQSAREHSVVTFSSRHKILFSDRIAGPEEHRAPGVTDRRLGWLPSTCDPSTGSTRALP